MPSAKKDSCFGMAHPKPRPESCGGPEEGCAKEMPLQFNRSGAKNRGTIKLIPTIPKSMNIPTDTRLL